MPIEKILCTSCGSMFHYQTFCPYKKRKAISQRGKETLKYEHFRDNIARPHLTKKFGEVCSVLGCDETENLDVDHKRGRGSHSELKYTLANLRYLCRPHHRQVTDGIKLRFKKVG